MYRNKYSFLIILMILAILSACSEKPALSTQATNNPVTIQVESEPNPPTMGDVEFVLTILDDQGQPFEGAVVDVGVDHIDMSGMEMNGMATQQSPGKYAITANFSMTGNWEMTVIVRKDGFEYQEVFSLKVQ